MCKYTIISNNHMNIVFKWSRSRCNSWDTKLQYFVSCTFMLPLSLVQNPLLSLGTSSLFICLSFTSLWTLWGQRWVSFIFASSMPTIGPGTKYEGCSISVNWNEWINNQQISRLYLCPYFVSYPLLDLLVYQKGGKRDWFIWNTRTNVSIIYHKKNSMIYWKEKGPKPQRHIGTYFGFVTMPAGWSWVSYLSFKVLNSLICK